MKTKLILTTLIAAMGLSAFAGSKTIYTTSLTRDVNKTAEQTTRFQVNTNVLCELFNRTDAAALNKSIDAKTIKLIARNGTNGKTYSTLTYDSRGFWYNANGVCVNASSTARRIACKYEDGNFKFIHLNNSVQEGDKYSIGIMLVQNTDTVQYEFDVTMGTADQILSTDQPAFTEKINHRADRIESWSVTPSVRVNEQTPKKQNYVQAMAGETITLDCNLPEGATSARFTWKNRVGKTLQTLKANSAWVINGAAPEDAGYYVLSGRYTLDGKTVTFKDCYYFVDVQTEALGTPFSWEGHVPQFSHNWKNDSKYKYGVYEQPTKLLGDVDATDRNGKPTQWVEGDWWAVCWGSNLNSTAGKYDSEEVKKCAENMIKKYDDDFAYIRDYMGWPPDLRARNGYKSLVYIFGSGLKKDNTANTEQGGYQSAIWYSDPKTGISANWPCVWASYLPFSRFRDDADSKWSDGDYQREAMIHEGIHAIFADLDACKKSAWFHEAGNTWLQSAMNTERYNKYGTPGFLDACPFIAPFMPVECYSGWLQDGSFGGPTAEGVNMYNEKGQVCTWRNLLGGNQYGNAFPIILGEICGKGSIPWIWRNCSDYVLKGIGNYLGEETMRQLIQQYRSRMATFDIGGWKQGYRAVTNSNFGVTVKAEWEPYWIDVAPFKLTMYQGLTKNDADYWMAPDTLTNPGWSGANIIPIHVDSKANAATIEFRPEDTEMRAQLCYVTKDGKNYYSQPVQCGKMQIDITDRPANNVIFLVVCNTDYLYTNDNNEAQRKKHWDYRVRFGEGALAVADLYTKWNLNEQTLRDANFDEASAREESEIRNEAVGIENTELKGQYIPGQNGVKLISGMATAGHPIRVSLSNANAEDVRVSMIGLSGIIADEAPLSNDCTYTLPTNLAPGLYFIKFTQNGKTDTFKVIVK